MRRLLSLSGIMGLLLLLGCQSGGSASLKILSDAYILINGVPLQNCAQYRNYQNGDHLYWVDPDGAKTGMEPFKVYCDMENGGYAVFESSSVPAFPHVNLTDTTVTFFSDDEITQINALRNVAEDIQAESDLTVTFATDTSSGGCNGTPVIGTGVMLATTLPLDVDGNTTETAREFSGSADHVEIQFNSSTNQFEVTGQTPAAGGCTDAIVNRFGVGENIWLKELKLVNQSSRAFSKVSGTFYHVRVK